MTHSFPLKAISAIVALTLVTLLAFQFYPQYRVSAEPAFSSQQEGFSAWQKSGVDRLFTITEDSASITLDRPGYNARLIRTVTPPFSEGPVHLRAQISSTNLRKGEETWHTGALVLVREDEAGKRIGSYTLFPLNGTHDWRAVEAFVDIPAPTARLSVVARMLESQGMFSIRDVSLTPAKAQPGFPFMHAGLIALWAIVGLVILIGLVRRHRVNAPLLVLGLIAALTLAGTLMPKENVVGLDDGISSYLPAGTLTALSTVIDTALAGYLADSSQAISKFGHWLAFFSLTAVALLMLRATPVWLILLAGLAVAAATEALQLLTAARTPHVIDVLIDASGMLMALALVLPLRWWLQRRGQPLETDLANE